MAIKFDGKQEAKVLSIKYKVSSIKGKRKLVAIVVGQDEGSLLYQKLKRLACEKAGISYELKIYPTSREAILAICQCNNDSNVTGIMVQLPVPNKEELIGKIDPKKDVDGMRDDSPFVAPVVQAVMYALGKAAGPERSRRMGVVGASGFVGKKIVKQLREFESVRVEEINEGEMAKIKDCDVVISATGKSYLIKPEMIKNGAVLIDVGAPNPEFDPACYEKASFYTPVPGGIGPLTIAYLIKNLLA